MSYISLFRTALPRRLLPPWYLAHKKHPPVGRYSSPVPLGTCGDPMGVGGSHERGTPVHGACPQSHRSELTCRSGRDVFLRLPPFGVVMG